MLPAELDRVARYWTFVQARHQIYRDKAAGKPPPWTDDPFLSRYQFTNMYRELDTGTIWLRQWREQQALSAGEALFAYSIYRWINHVPTFDEVGLPVLNAAAIAEWNTRLLQRRDEGRTCQTLHHRTPRIETLEDLAQQFLTSAYSDIVGQVQEAHDGVEAAAALLGIKGIGPFFAVQVTADFIRDPLSHLFKDTKMPLAVGSQMGVHYIRTGSLINTTKYKMPKLLISPEAAAVLDHLHDNQPAGIPVMTYTDIEHALCEWNRYTKGEEGMRIALRSYKGAA